MALITIKKKDFIPESFERMVNNLLNDTKAEHRGEYTKEENRNILRAFNPKTNIIEKESEYEIQLALPGWEKQQINLSVDSEILIISGTKEQYKKDGDVWHRYEFDFGKFEKRFQLTDEVSDEIQAEMKNGLLHVYVKKALKTTSQKSIKVE